MERSELEAQWTSGDPLPGVAFRRDEVVRIIEGPFTDEVAWVRQLIELRPEPCYSVEIEAAHVTLPVPQSALTVA
jgi:hypothetical protein